jgi:hypothetical protein
MNGRKTTKPPSGGLSLNHRFAGSEWRATVDETGHYSFAVAL